MLKSIDAELKLVIAGNHDIDLGKDYWETHLDEGSELEDHGRTLRVMTGPLAMQAGVTYLSEGTHSSTLRNGARFTIYISPYSPAFSDWAFAYDHNEDRFNAPHQVAQGIKSIAKDPIPSFPHVDIVMTHGPPKGILDECAQGNVGCANIRRALRRAKPKMHCFGHIHESSGAEIVDWSDDAAPVSCGRKNEAVHRHFEEDQILNPYPQPFQWRGNQGDKTLAINASIMDGHYKPTNAPWIISLDLARSPQH